MKHAHYTRPAPSTSPLPQITPAELAELGADGRLIVVERDTAAGRIRQRVRLSIRRHGRIIYFNSDAENIGVLDVDSLRRHAIPVASLRRAVIDGHRYSIAADVEVAA